MRRVSQKAEINRPLLSFVSELGDFFVTIETETARQRQVVGVIENEYQFQIVPRW